jgi:SAM-dependent methyltransferase
LHVHKECNQAGGGLAEHREDAAVTQATDPARPRRADVANSYNLGVGAYEALWSPVILPPAESLVRHLDLSGSGLVVDVGAGTGALLGAIRSAAPAARTVALDASARMLQVARTRRGASAVLADAVALPLADGCASAVILAYVLFHLQDPVWALAEAARVLGPAGRAGTVTWGWERAPRASGMWSQILADAGVAPGPLRHADTGLDTPDAVAATLRSAGLQPECIWSQPLRRQWDRSSYFRLASGGGASRARLSLVDSATRAKVLVLLRRRLEQLSPGDLLWEVEVICAVATRSVSRTNLTVPPGAEIRWLRLTRGPQPPTVAGDRT